MRYPSVAQWQSKRLIIARSDCSIHPRGTIFCERSNCVVSSTDENSWRTPGVSGRRALYYAIRVRDKHLGWDALEMRGGLNSRTAHQFMKRQWIQHMLTRSHGDATQVYLCWIEVDRHVREGSVIFLKDDPDCWRVEKQYRDVRINAPPHQDWKVGGLS